jgi:alpha-beta hydrolase superfamily lysophospholipase
MLWKIVSYTLIGYLILCALVFLMQRRLLYLADGTPLSEAQAIKVGLRHWPSPAQLHGFISQEPTHPKGTIIVFHGNAGTAYQRGFYARALFQQNFRVILAEYPGYGGRSGQPSETVLIKDALETIRLASQQYGEPLFLWGESLGCGVVAGAVAQTKLPVWGVVLFLPWDSLSNLAQTHYWYLPARRLVLDQYNNIENLRGFKGNIAVILAGDDEVIPVHHGQRLYDALTTQKKLWLFAGARHNEMPVAADLGWWQEVVDFISQ